MAELTTCPYCDLFHARRDDGLCPRCGLRPGPQPLPAPSSAAQPPRSARVSWKAVVVGGLTDGVATFLLMFAVAGYLSATLRGRVADWAVPGVVGGMLEHDPAVQVITFLGGGLCTVLGGYVAAWIAGHDEQLNGALSSIVLLALGLVGLASGRSSSSATLAQLGALLLTPVLAWTGGFLRALQLRRRARAAAERSANVFS